MASNRLVVKSIVRSTKKNFTYKFYCYGVSLSATNIKDVCYLHFSDTPRLVNCFSRTTDNSQIAGEEHQKHAKEKKHESKIDKHKKEQSHIRGFAESTISKTTTTSKWIKKQQVMSHTCKHRNRLRLPKKWESKLAKHMSWSIIGIVHLYMCSLVLQYILRHESSNHIQMKP